MRSSSVNLQSKHTGDSMMLVWTIVTIVLLAVLGYLRFVVYPHLFVPLTSSLVLLPCLWHRSFRLLWGATAIILLMVVVKVAFVMPRYDGDHHQWLFAAMQVANAAIPAAVIHVVIQMTKRLAESHQRLEVTNAELEASNEELATREEEISHQNEELQSQAEELEQQTEELNSQASELQTLNEQLMQRERTLVDLLQESAGGISEAEAFAKLGQLVHRMFSGRVVAAAVLEMQGETMQVHSLKGLHENSQAIPCDASLAALVLKKACAAGISDLGLRPDLQMPQLAAGQSVRAVIAAPFHITGELRAALEIYSTSKEPWSNHDLRIAQWIADQCGLMWTAARLWQEREQLLESERAARFEAQHANRMKDEFVATLSHELRTPLNAVLGWASLLAQSDFKDASEVKDGIEVIERNARHQKQLISDLLDISRIMAGKVRLNEEVVDLPQLIENAIETIRFAAEAKGIRLEKHLQRVDRAVHGDPTRLQQIVWNLLSNAIKFTPKGGHVTVTVSRVASYVQICVTDSGEGIEPDLLPHIFDRYRQADGSASRRHAGLGLGLSITKTLVEMHGGSIHVKSEGEGKGSVFMVLLPVRAVDTDATVTPDRPADSTTGMKLRVDASILTDQSVLVIDDESDARDIIRHILQGYGARVTTADSADRALKLVSESDFDVIISDIGMPGIDGYEFIRELRNGHRGRLIPVIALTAFAQPQDRSRVLSSGFQAHISKPVEVSELVSTIANLKTINSG